MLKDLPYIFSETLLDFETVFLFFSFFWRGGGEGGRGCHLKFEKTAPNLYLGLVGLLFLLPQSPKKDNLHRRLCLQIRYSEKFLFWSSNKFWYSVLTLWKELIIYIYIYIWYFVPIFLDLLSCNFYVLIVSEVWLPQERRIDRELSKECPIFPCTCLETHLYLNFLVFNSHKKAVSLE